MGHIVSKNGIATDPRKVKAILDWPRPKTVTEVHSFTGFTNYYRRFIKGYAKVARPLHELTSGENGKKKHSKVQWTDRCQESFDSLKKICSESPVLAYADYAKPFVLHNDASTTSMKSASVVGKDERSSSVDGDTRRSPVDTAHRRSTLEEKPEIDRTPLEGEQLEKLYELTKLAGGTSEWTPEQQQRAKDVIKKYSFLFAMGTLDLGKTNLVKHKIELTDYTPIKDTYHRIPPHQYEEVRKHLKEMLDVGAIRRSNSPWASPVVLVRKKDGSLRFCIDLRKLNARTIKDAYSLPRIEDALDSLNGACIFTSLDLKSGYWQVELDESSIPLTAFTVGPLGFYECVRMPFGLTNAPATFQRLMESCLGELHLEWCIIYLDDIIIFSKNPDDHLTRLEGVFERLAKAGLKLKPSKCEFF